jgi:hypothetical protein
MVAESVALACDLIEAEVATSPIIDVATLSPAASGRDAGERILAMLEDLGYVILDMADEGAAWELVL